MGKTNHQNADAVRNIIRSHNTMLISMPQEVSMRAGLARGVQVRVGQDIANPTTITMEVINPVDRKAELKAYLAEQKLRADNRAAKEKRKKDWAKKEKKRLAAKEKEELAEAKKATEKKAEEMEAAAKKAAEQPVEEQPVPEAEAAPK